MKIDYFIMDRHEMSNYRRIRSTFSKINYLNTKLTFRKPTFN